jgi:UDP-glucose 4-epimerase
MKVFITGGAGFIGSHLADKFLQNGHDVVVYDSLVTGHRHFIKHNLDNASYSLIEGDVLDYPLVKKSSAGCDLICHMQANADVRGGIHNTKIDLEQNIICTHNVLEAARENNIKKILFASSATVYGDPFIFPTPEDSQLVQTSLYGASKVSAESLIQAYCEAFGMQSWIFRFVSFLGNRYTHGVVFDFVKKLITNPAQLEILGDGGQKKSYLDVEDGVAAMLLALEKANDKINIFNLGNKTYMNVLTVADIICKEMKLDNVRYNFTGGNRGWIGDSPFVHLDISRISSLGWIPKYSIEESVKRTAAYLLSNEDLLNSRK